MTTTEKTNTDRMAARVEEGERKMATDGKEHKMKITASNLIRWAGLSAMVAGIICSRPFSRSIHLTLFLQSPPAHGQSSPL